MNRRFVLSLIVVLAFGLLLTGCGNGGTTNSPANVAGSQAAQAGGAGRQQSPPQFVADNDYNVKKQINMPKVIFVYSDPTPHHPEG